jgi:hypothetical protein
MALDIHWMAWHGKEFIRLSPCFTNLFGLSTLSIFDTARRFSWIDKDFSIQHGVDVFFLLLGFFLLMAWYSGICFLLFLAACEVPLALFFCALRLDSYASIRTTLSPCFLSATCEAQSTIIHGVMACEPSIWHKLFFHWALNPWTCITHRYCLINESIQRGHGPNTFFLDNQRQLGMSPSLLYDNVQLNLSLGLSFHFASSSTRPSISLHRHILASHRSSNPPRRTR